jgi:hypothetical protein
LAHYCGTGGAVIDTKLLGASDLYECPRRYWFIEDLWASYVALNMGWNLTGSAATFSFIEDSRDQFHQHIYTKEAMYRHLYRKRGFNAAHQSSYLQDTV